MKVALAFACGALFAFGLVLSGMTTPRTVTGFLDVTRDWNPTLAFVMAGAIGVYAPISWLVRRRTRPLLDTRFHWPAPSAIDTRLVVGAALFGVGWGLSGYCPGPALVSAGTGVVEVAIFVGAMIAGTAIVRLARPEKPEVTA